MMDGGELREVFGEALVELGQKNPEVIVLDADLSTSTRTSLFRERFPRRFIQCGIAECNMVSIAAGLAHLGYIPFPVTFAAFAARKALDQVYMAMAVQQDNIKLVGAYCGMTAGECGPSHNSGEDLAIMRAMPGLRVIDPADGFELRSALFEAAAYRGPVYMRVSRITAVPLFREDHRFRWGGSEILREGEDIALFSTGMMTRPALETAELLSAHGIQASVIHMPSVKPLDADTILRYAERTRCVLTLENGRVAGGFGSAVCELLSAQRPTLIDMAGFEDTLILGAPVDDLLVYYRLTPSDLAKRATALVRRKN